MESTKRYILRRRSDGKYYNPNGRWSKSRGWVESIEKAKIYSNPGHPKNAVGEYVDWKYPPAERKRRRQVAFDEAYEIVTVHLSL